MNDAQHPPLQVRLLGVFEVEVSGRLIPASSWRRRAADVLKLVALAPSRALPRDEVIERIWPDKDRDRGANNLHRALHDLRGILGGSYVALRKGVLRLTDEAHVDVDRFLAALAEEEPAQRREALRLYRGHLCADDPYSPFLDEARAQLLRRFTDASLRAAHHDLALGQLAEATATLRRLLEVEPSHEDAHRLLARSLARLGRKQDALDQLDTCATALRTHLDAAPARATLALREELAVARPGAPKLPTTTAGERIARRLLGSSRPGRLVGREQAMREGRAFVEAPQGVLFVIGEAGVGKTRLAVELAAHAEERGSAVLAGSGLEIEGMSPYMPFVEALGEHLRASGRSEGESPFAAGAAGAGASADGKLHIFQAVARTLADAAAGGAAFLLLDDVHLADESSLDLLHFLARATRTQRLLLVATSREEAVAQSSALQRLLAVLHRERLLRRLSLPRLDQEATCALVAQQLGYPTDEETAASVFRLSGGNAFYAEEIAHALSEGEVVQVPDDLADAVRARVARLGAGAEQLLTVASVVGQRFDFELVAEGAQLSGEEALCALERCLQARFVEEDDQGYRFRHALVREALYGALTRARRERLHLGVAELFEQERFGPLEEASETMAFHYAEARAPERAFPHLVVAGRRAARRLGFREAVALFELALAILDGGRVRDEAARFALLVRLGQARIALSELGAAVAHLDEAAAMSDGPFSPPERAKALRLAALAHLTAGNLDEAEERLMRALDEVGDVLDAEHPRALYHLAQLRWHQEAHDEAYAVAERCLAQAELLGDEELIARGYEMLALACHSLGRWREGAGFEEKRQTIVGATVDVAQAFDVHL